MSTALLRKYIDILQEADAEAQPGGFYGNKDTAKPAGTTFGMPDDSEMGGQPSNTGPAPAPAAGPLKIPTKSPSTEYLDIQRIIQALYPGALPEYGADGYYGPETKAAIEKFQTDNNLKVDGLVGSQTISALNKVLSDKKLPFKPSTPAEIAAPNQQPGDWKKSTTTPSANTTTPTTTTPTTTTPTTTTPATTTPATSPSSGPSEEQKKKISADLDKGLEMLKKANAVKESVVDQMIRYKKLLSEQPINIPPNTVATHNNISYINLSGAPDDWHRMDSNGNAIRKVQSSTLATELNSKVASAPQTAGPAAKTKSTAGIGWKVPDTEQPVHGSKIKMKDIRPGAKMFGSIELIWDGEQGRLTSTDPQIDAKLSTDRAYQTRMQQQYVRQSIVPSGLDKAKAAMPSVKKVGGNVLKGGQAAFGIYKAVSMGANAQEEITKGNGWAGALYIASAISYGIAGVVPLATGPVIGAVTSVVGDVAGLGLEYWADKLAGKAEETAQRDPNTIPLHEKQQIRQFVINALKEAQKVLDDPNTDPATREDYMKKINELYNELGKLK